ncbi:hypothetical protein [Acinetobacter sp. TSRC1-3]|uniref:hypothetical protein n=1 Tax=Acinetobacter sp. TSRC1-3 TaxID=2804625 RepID=UPI003CED7786
MACATLLPETRSKEHSASFKLSKTFHHYFKIYFDRKFIVYALTLCIAQAGFFAYLAGSASVFITEYKLTATQFSVLFAINALGLVAAAIFNPKLHQKFDALKTYRLVNTAYFIVIGLLFSLLCMGYHNLYIVCAGLFIAVTLLGFIMPTGSQLALMHQHEHIGTASCTTWFNAVRYSCDCFCDHWCISRLGYFRTDSGCFCLCTGFSTDVQYLI